jgi:DNA-directed RNA polymerase specialized sigma24 family protein
MHRDQDTAIGGPAARFPQTRQSAVIAVKSADRKERSAANQAIISAYWKPSYKYVRLKWGYSNEDTKDLVQSFFTRAIEKGLFRSYDPARASFRTFLRTCLDSFVANEYKAAGRWKRGGRETAVAIDFHSVEGELALEAPASDGPEEYFQKECVRSLFGIAIEELRALCAEQGRQDAFAIFTTYDLEQTPDITYARLADQFDRTVTNVTNQLAWARREFRRILIGTVRRLTGTEEEFRREMRDLLGRPGAA